MSLSHPEGICTRGHRFLIYRLLHSAIINALLPCIPSPAYQSYRTFSRKSYDRQIEYNEGQITLNETQASEKIKTAPGELPAPGGIGMAVAIDWGLTVQTLLTFILSFFRPSNQMIPPAFNRFPGTILFFVVALLFACIFVLLGEMLRRGHNWARWIQIIFNAVLSLAGLASLYSLYQSIKTGHFWPLVTEIILVIISPLIVWRLTRPTTAHWFKAVTVSEARRRHGGRWVWFIALFAIIGGVLQTFAAMSR